MSKLNTARSLYTIFLLYIIIISVIPFSKVMVYFSDYSMTYSNFLLLLLGLIVVPFASGKIVENKYMSISSKLLTFIILYGFISLSWSNQYFHSWYAVYQLLLAFLTFFVPYLLVRVISDSSMNYQETLTSFASVLSIVFIYYLVNMGESRFSGQIGGAAIIHMAIIPCIAVFVNNLSSKKKKIRSLFFLIVNFTSLMYTESRMALMTLILFFVLYNIQKLTKRKIILAMVVGLILLILLISLSSSSSRFATLGLTDSARSINTESSLLLATDTPLKFIFGNGYGNVWSWSSFQQGIRPSNFLYNSWLSTQHGPIMYHAHSIFNNLITELGLLGLVPYLIFLLIILRVWFNSKVENNEVKTTMLSTLIATIPSMHSDLFWFRNWEVSFIWFFFFFLTISYSSSDKI